MDFTALAEPTSGIMSKPNKKVLEQGIGQQFMRLAESMIPGSLDDLWKEAGKKDGDVSHRTIRRELKSVLTEVQRHRGYTIHDGDSDNTPGVPNATASKKLKGNGTPTSPPTSRHLLCRPYKPTMLIGMACFCFIIMTYLDKAYMAMLLMTLCTPFILVLLIHLLLLLLGIDSSVLAYFKVKPSVRPDWTFMSGWCKHNILPAMVIMLWWYDIMFPYLGTENVQVQTLMTKALQIQYKSWHKTAVLCVLLCTCAALWCAFHPTNTIGEGEPERNRIQMHPVLKANTTVAIFTCVAIQLVAALYGEYATRTELGDYVMGHGNYDNTTQVAIYSACDDKPCIDGKVFAGFEGCHHPRLDISDTFNKQKLCFPSVTCEVRKSSGNPQNTVSTLQEWDAEVKECKIDPNVKDENMTQRVQGILLEVFKRLSEKTKNMDVEKEEKRKTEIRKLSENVEQALFNKNRESVIIASLCIFFATVICMTNFEGPWQDEVEADGWALLFLVFPMGAACYLRVFPWNMPDVVGFHSLATAGTQTSQIYMCIVSYIAYFLRLYSKSSGLGIEDMAHSTINAIEKGAKNTKSAKAKCQSTASNVVSILYAVWCWSIPLMMIGVVIFVIVISRENYNYIVSGEVITDIAGRSKELGTKIVDHGTGVGWRMLCSIPAWKDRNKSFVGDCNE